MYPCALKAQMETEAAHAFQAANPTFQLPNPLHPGLNLLK